jgi:hypothetical protein
VAEPLGDDAVVAIVRENKGDAEAEWRRLSMYEAYYAGLHNKPYRPPTATREFDELMRRCTTNITRLVCNTMTQRLILDGYKSSSTSTDNAKPWEWFQDNGLDARQKALYDEAAKHGYAYVQVLPGEKNDGSQAPVIRPVSGREWYCRFDAYIDDWPLWALRKVDERDWQVLDDVNAYTVRDVEGGVRIVESVPHGLNTVPMVIFRNTFELTRWPTGEIEPVIAVQDRLNQTVFDLLVAQTYAAAPQKWIAGLSVPVDEQGKPITDLRAFAKSVWIDSDPNTKFGSLPEANLKNIVEAIEQALRMYGLMSQTPPHYLLGDLVNLSAEALLAADTTLAKKVNDRQALYGEAWEQAFRLAGVAAGDAGAATDTAAQVWWRDTEPRSIAQQVDALGKLATMLTVPPEALWEQVPGVTRTDLEYWRAEAAKARLRAAAEQRRLAEQQAVAPPAVSGGPGTAGGQANPATPNRGAA